MSNQTMNVAANITLERAEALLSNAVYAATGLLEELEAAGKIVGNGHHARQRVAEAAVLELRKRWGAEAAKGETP